MRIAPLLPLVVLACVAACSSSAIGTAEPSDAGASAIQAVPAEGEACTCTSPYGAVPTVDCCQGDLVCKATSPPSCDQGSKQCFRTGTCVQWYEDDPRTSTPPPARSRGETCDPLAYQCDPGSSCVLSGSYWRCS